MKTPTSLLLALLPACAHSEATPKTPASPGEVRSELVSITRSTDADATATFRVSNGSSAPITYLGYSKDGPLYQCEVLEEGQWKPSPLGWCGTGTSTYTLAPGESQSFTAIVPASGASYRFRFGEPPVVTPPVSFTAK